MELEASRAYTKVHGRFYGRKWNPHRFTPRFTDFFTQENRSLTDVLERVYGISLLVPASLILGHGGRSSEYSLHHCVEGYIINDQVEWFLRHSGCRLRAIVHTIHRNFS